jgi:hypothetical protein
MEEHFKLKDSIYLVADGHELDLHNNFDFQGVDYAIQNRTVRLQWRKGLGEWVPKDDPSEVSLTYADVSRFEFHPRDPGMPFTEDDCLSDAGYWTDDDWADGVFTTEGDPEPKWLRAFQFQSGAIILIHAAEAHATIKR